MEQEYNNPNYRENQNEGYSINSENEASVNEASILNKNNNYEPALVKIIIERKNKIQLPNPFDGLIKNKEFGKRVEFWYNLFNLFDPNNYPQYEYNAWASEEDSIKELEKVEKFEVLMIRAESSIPNLFPKILEFGLRDRLKIDTIGFKFIVTKLEYNSIDLAVEVLGARYLASQLSNHLDLFINFLTIFSPIALSKAIGYTDDGSSFNTLVNPSLELERAFHKPREESSIKGKPEQKVGPIVKEKWNLLWILSNTSLIIPFALAIWVLIIAYKDAAQTRDRYNNAHDSIFVHQQHIINDQTQLIKEQLQIIKFYKDSLVK